jgi:hypothetical protein
MPLTTRTLRGLEAMGRIPRSVCVLGRENTSLRWGTAGSCASVSSESGGSFIWLALMGRDQRLGEGVLSKRESGREYVELSAEAIVTEEEPVWVELKLGREGSYDGWDASE